jgi:ABC-type phosphate/phosphonate transport system substrate-binding protein
MRWDLEQTATWLDNALVAGMTCGWPLVRTLREQVRVVGTFAYDLDGAPSHLYRSRIIARADDRPHLATIAADASAVAAINSSDSLSGCISLLAALGGGGTQWQGEVLWTGAHLASIDAVRDGRAALASIDALTWAYHARDVPDAVAGLATIGRGPSVPCLPLIVNANATDAELAAWRTGFASAVQDPATAWARETLMIRGFVPLDYNDYVTALHDLEIFAEA